MLTDLHNVFFTKLDSDCDLGANYLNTGKSHCNYLYYIGTKLCIILEMRLASLLVSIRFISDLYQFLTVCEVMDMMIYKLL